MNSVISKISDRTYFRRTIIRSKARYFRAIAKNWLKPKKTILFYPEMPEAGHLVYLACHLLGYRMTTDPNAKFDLAIAFMDTTVRPPNARLASLSAKHHVLNAGCGDISKERVDRVFLETFGYGITIDPRTYKGPYIKKTNTNALHGAKIMDKPTEPEKGFVYQKLIDNRSTEGYVRDIRTFIFDGRIPFTIHREHPTDDRFGDNGVIASLVDTEKSFSEKEQADILRFCKNFGFDYGDLDILRDKDGKIYIVDANNTPTGPRSGIHISKQNYARFLGKLTAAFEAMALRNT